MSVKNSYPEKPELQYRRTQVHMPDVVIALKALDVPTAVKRSAYVTFRIESANGRSGINNNYAGMQADVGRWPAKYDHLIEGTCIRKENGQDGKPGAVRRFLCFRSFDHFIAMYADRWIDRGIYVGGHAHYKAKMVITNERDLCRAYYKDWVKGDRKFEPSEERINNFLSMYAQARTIFT